MDKAKGIALQNKILDGLKLSYQRLLEEKKKNNSKLVVYRDGRIQILDAIQIDTKQP